ncbi:transglycosylase SLT domain-containing protein [Roseicitreum antarcticum]|uniref:transglycosylase SLT domain-containing protein n=1 Tax=Roseicitreum antarcticum TaxID=564137 RepID=UPI0015A03FF3|nr:transglycosylase SLT domain-containing protein [Roseicitreum antarcticum]
MGAGSAPIGGLGGALRRRCGALTAVAGLALLVACAPTTRAPAADSASEISTTRWDHRPEASLWTLAAYRAMDNGGAALVESLPRDIDAFCPGYDAADADGRKAFWTGLFSGLAQFESGWRPEAAGGGGRYRGLLQISPATARYHGCDLSAPGGLYDGATNLACASRIAASAVARDGVVVGGPGNWGGVAADWPPMRDTAKRARIAEFTRELPACQG